MNKFLLLGVTIIFAVSATKVLADCTPTPTEEALVYPIPTNEVLIDASSSATPELTTQPTVTLSATNTPTPESQASSNSSCTNCLVPKSAPATGRVQ